MSPRTLAPRAPRVFAALLAIMCLIVPGIAIGKDFGDWATAVPETGINTAAGEGCPIESPDGRSLFFASNRAGTLGGNDIWVAHRAHEGAQWSEPENLGAPVNSEYNDYCPTPLVGNLLLFVSERPGAETCNAGPGAGDIYLVRHNPAHGWGTPQHLGCDADGSGPNFPGSEYGPSLFGTSGGVFLYFSSTGYGADMNIYSSRMRTDGTFEPASLVAELNTTAADFMPNVSPNGLEVVFNSNRVVAGAQGGQDVYVATRSSTRVPWSEPVNLGPTVNTAGGETRSSLSGDGYRLHFGRDGDIYVSSRVTVPAGR